MTERTTLDASQEWAQAFSSPATRSVVSSVGTHTRCGCGNVFMPDSAYCRKCGARRLDDLDNDFSSQSVLRTGQKIRFPPHWGVPPLVQTRDYCVWPEGYGAGSSTVAEWISENLKKDASRVAISTAQSAQSWSSVPTQPLRDPIPSLGNASACAAAAAAAAASAAAAVVSSSSGWQRSAPRTPREGTALQGLDSVRTPRNSLTGGRPSSCSSVVGRQSEPTVRAWNKAFATEGQPQPLHRTSSETRLSTKPLVVGTTKVTSTQLAVQDHRYHHRSLAARMGAATARKVAEIERLLLEELEVSLVLKAGFIASCLHSWRRMASLDRCHRFHQDELQEQKVCFHRDLATMEFDFKKHLSTTAQRRKERLLHKHQLMLDRWREGDDLAIQRVVLMTWLSWAVQEHRYAHGQHLKNIVGSVLSRFAQYEANGKLGFAMYAWTQAVMESHGTAHFHKLLERTALRWSDDAGNCLLATCFVAWYDRKKHSLKVLAQLMNSTSRGTILVALRSWVEAFKSGKVKRERTNTIEKLQLQFAQQASLQRPIVQLWYQLARHQKVINQENKRLEDMLDGERSKRQVEERQRRDQAKAAKERAHNAVAIMVKKWEMGGKKGLLYGVFKPWSSHSKKMTQTARQLASVHTAIDKFLLGEKRGKLHINFLNWKQDYIDARLTRVAEGKANKHIQELQQLLSDEKARNLEIHRKHETQLEVHMRTLDKLLGFSLSKAARGDKNGLLEGVLRFWLSLIDVQRKKDRQTQAVHAGIEKALLGEARGILTSAFTNWHTYARLEASRERSQEALMLSVLKWAEGDEKALKSRIVSLWWRQVEIAQQSNAIAMAVLKGCKGDEQATRLMALHGWRFVAKLEKTSKDANAQKSKELEAIAQQSQTLLGKAQEKLARYTANLANYKGQLSPVFVANLLAAWRSHTHGALAQLANRKVNEEFEAMKKKGEYARARHKEMLMASVRKLGLNGDKAIKKDAFLEWRTLLAAKKMQTQLRLMSSKSANKLGDYLVLDRIKKNARELVSICFAEYVAVVRVEMRERERSDVRSQLEEANTYVLQVEQQRNSLEEQLWLAYKQIDHITDTLQKELKTKEELATELRDAYRKMRVSSFQGLTSYAMTPSTTVASRSRPGSASSHRNVEQDSRFSHAQSSLTWQETSGYHGGIERVSYTAEEGRFDPQAVLSGLTVSRAALYDAGRDDLGETNSRCTWGDAVKAMKSEGLLHDDREIL